MRITQTIISAAGAGLEFLPDRQAAQTFNQEFAKRCEIGAQVVQPFYPRFNCCPEGYSRWVPQKDVNATDIANNTNYYFSLANDYMNFSKYDVFVVHALVGGEGRQAGWRYPEQSVNLS